MGTGMCRIVKRNCEVVTLQEADKKMREGTETKRNAICTSQGRVISNQVWEYRWEYLPLAESNNSNLKGPCKNFKDRVRQDEKSRERMGYLPGRPTKEQKNSSQRKEKKREGKLSSGELYSLGSVAGCLWEFK